MRLISRRGPAALVWSVVSFIALQLALTLYMDRGHPELYDAEYGYRLYYLHERLGVKPAHPFVLVLGSSRVELGLRPDVLPCRAEAPDVFNFGLTGAGPVTELLCL